MKKNLKTIILLLIMLICPVLTGCNLSCTQEETPRELTIFTDSKTLAWTRVLNASGYSVYCNDTLVDTLDDNEYIYDFSHLTKEKGTYKFRVTPIVPSLAYGNKLAREGTFTQENNEPVRAKMEDIKELPVLKEASVLNAVISFTPLDVDTDYYMAVYSNSIGYRIIDMTGNVVIVNDTAIASVVPAVHSGSKEILAIRMGYMEGSDFVAITDTLYFNPDNYAGYTDNIYIFDGKIYDHYINNLDELKTLMYRSFIYRIEDFDIKLSSEIYDMVGVFDGGNFEESLDLLIFLYGFGSFSETSAYMSGNIVGGERFFTSAISEKDKTYNVKVTYLGVTECDLNLTPSQSINMNQENSVPYYEAIDFYTLREEYGDDYDNFVSDRMFLKTEVKTSEELYWAVENGVTPTFPNKTCRAYKIYNQAKETIKDIISEDMTDYEKVLSIFDWICVNTTYDYSSYADEQTLPTKLPCYYLEGVFNKGVAVCDGFSKSFSLMCNMLGIDAIRIVGTARANGNEDGHAWNKVLLDKDPSDNIPAEYYLVDITWTELFNAYDNEVLSHQYFLVSDDMVKNSHTDFNYRKKFNDYVANTHYEYYSNSAFVYKDVQYDLVIDKDSEIAPIFNYMLENATDTMEVVFDLDYLIDIYEERNGKVYNPASDYKISVDLGRIDYYSLREVVRDIFKANKFNEQYIFMAYSLSDIMYTNDGKTGLIYTLTQNLLIDADGEVEHLVEKLDTDNIYGEFTLYIDNNFLTSISPNYVNKVKALFADALSGKDISIEFKLLETNVSYDNEHTGTIYSMVVSAAA